MNIGFFPKLDMMSIIGLIYGIEQAHSSSSLIAKEVDQFATPRRRPRNKSKVKRDKRKKG